MSISKLLLIIWWILTECFLIIAAELWGFDKYIEPFATVKGVDMFKGVNYASGAAGILDETAIHMVIV